MPKIIAHRGASAHAPENTMAAFQLALDHGADGVELDVMLSKDHQPVVIHDDTVDRTTNGSGLVKEMTLAEIQSLDAGDGQSIPSLEEVFDQFGGRFIINVELKNYTSIFDSLPIEVAKRVKNYQIEESILISSFNPFNLPRFHSRLPEVELGLLTQPNQAKKWVWRLFHFDALHPYFSDVDQVLVASLHDRNRKVNVWTVDEDEEIRRLAALNVDSIITNDPKHTRGILEA
ncbi:MAG: glycerophosphodiester phosphodiesterase family protein [Chloroflexota bacterium]|nr:glycerophosphodiester phosphodiesterase family protein [Chloroflexota bacterium]